MYYITPFTISFFKLRVIYISVLQLYHILFHVKYSVSMYVWDIVVFWNSIICHSMYNILFQCACDICLSETVSYIILYTIFYFNVRVRYNVFLNLYHMSIHVQYSLSIYVWDIVVFWNCITCQSFALFNCDVSRPHTTALIITILCHSHVSVWWIYHNSQQYTHKLHIFNIFFLTSVLTIIKITFNDNFWKNNVSVNVTSMRFKQLDTLSLSLSLSIYIYIFLYLLKICTFKRNIFFTCTVSDIKIWSTQQHLFMQMTHL